MVRKIKWALRALNDLHGIYGLNSRDTLLNSEGVKYGALMVVPAVQPRATLDALTRGMSTRDEGQVFNLVDIW